MPLIIITGIPCSAKTTKTSEIRAFFEEKHGKQVHVVSEMNAVKNAGFEKNSYFGDSQKEKHIRGSLKSEVIRLLSPDNVVILDAANYIKGYRYELYCASKNSKSTQCTIHTLANFEKAWISNSSRLPKDSDSEDYDNVPYTREVFDALIHRYEEPNSQNRWDNPLFTVMDEDVLNMDSLYSVLFEKKPPPPNMSTQNPPLSSTNFLYELDKITLDIAKAIFEAKNVNPDGDIRLPSYPSVTLRGSSLADLTAPRLSRLRRQFLSYAKMHYSNTDVSKIGILFLQYLNTTLKE